MCIRIWLVEPNTLFRETFSKSLREDSRFCVPEELKSGMELLERIREQRMSFDLLVLEVAMRGSDGISTAKRLLEAYPEKSVVFLSGRVPGHIKQKMFSTGACGYISKHNPLELVKDALVRAAGGKFVSLERAYDPCRDYAAYPSDEQAYGKITSREIDIIRLLADGYTSREIAEELDISFNTVITHRSNIRKKTKMDNSALITSFAIRNGIYVP